MADPLRYFFDEHMRAAIAEQLRARRIDVLTALDAGRANRRIDDADQLAFAAQEGRVLVTEDHHFADLAQSRKPHAGVVYFPNSAQHRRVRRISGVIGPHHEA